jgi:di/tricarboxylate transporter
MMYRTPFGTSKFCFIHAFDCCDCFLQLTRFIVYDSVEWDTLLFFAGLFVLVEACAAMGLLKAIGDFLADFIEQQDEDKQMGVAITLIVRNTFEIWYSPPASALGTDTCFALYSTVVGKRDYFCLFG